MVYLAHLLLQDHALLMFRGGSGLCPRLKNATHATRGVVEVRLLTLLFVGFKLVVIVVPDLLVWFYLLS